MRLTAERRTQLEQRGGEIYRNALQAGRKPTDDEQTELRSIELQLDRDSYEQQFGEQPSAAQQRFTQTATEQRTAERPLILAPEVRMRDWVRGTYPAEYDGLSLGKYLRGWLTGNWNDAELERRAMAIGTTGAGGALVPTPLSANVIDAIRKQAVVFRAGATAVPMSSPTLKLARLATDPTAAWTAENAAITASDGVFEGVTFTAMKLAALVKCSIELIEDAPNSSTVIENALAEVLALELDRVSLFGTGTNEPKGVHAYANTVVSEVVVGANGAQLTSYDKLSDGYFTVVGNNVSPSSAIYAPRTAKTLDQLKTGSTLEPLPAPPSWGGLSKFVTNQVPVNITQGSANNASSVIIGAFSGLGIGMRTELVIEASRTAGDSFKDGQVWIRAYLRGDVQLLQPKAFCNVRGIIP